MEREEFIKKFNEASGDISEMRLRLLTNKAINVFKDVERISGYHELIIAMEELSELQKEISKFLRGKGDKFALIEEMGDVLICIVYLQEIFNIPTWELYKAMNIKIDRLQDVLASGEGMNDQSGTKKS